MLTSLLEPCAHPKCPHLLYEVLRLCHRALVDVGDVVHCDSLFRTGRNEQQADSLLCFAGWVHCEGEQVVYRATAVNRNRVQSLIAQSVPHTAGQARAGQPNACRAFAQAIFVLAILSAKSSSNSFAISSGGPDSMMLRSGKPWLKSWPKLLGRDRLT